jgi:hypothetical protein
MRIAEWAVFAAIWHSIVMRIYLITNCSLSIADISNVNRQNLSIYTSKRNSTMEMYSCLCSLTSINLSSVDSALAITAGLDENPLDIISGATVSAVDLIPLISVQYSAYASTASSAVSAQLALLSFTAFCRNGAALYNTNHNIYNIRNIVRYFMLVRCSYTKSNIRCNA